MIYLVYKTDNWHSYKSRDIIGIATSPDNAVQLVCNQVSKDGEKLSDDDQFNLNNIKQTQGYKGEGEFVFEEVETDVLL